MLFIPSVLTQMGGKCYDQSIVHWESTDLGAMTGSVSKTRHEFHRVVWTQNIFGEWKSFNKWRAFELNWANEKPASVQNAVLFIITRHSCCYKTAAETEQSTDHRCYALKNKTYSVNQWTVHWRLQLLDRKERTNRKSSTLTYWPEDRSRDHGQSSPPS